MVTRRFKTIFWGIILVCFWRGTLPYAFAESAIQCHCFKDRSYNQTDRFAADDYLLATSFNSLLANHYDISKRQIIMMKMSDGVAQEDLLIALHTRKVTGMELQKLLHLRRRNNTWRKIISKLQPQGMVEKDKTLSAISSGMEADDAGTQVANEMLAEFFTVPAANINTLREYGLNEKEITLVLMLSHVSEIQPELLVQQYKEQGRSWSEITHNLGLEPEATGRLILDYPDNQIPK